MNLHLLARFDFNWKAWIHFIATLRLGTMHRLAPLAIIDAIVIISNIFILGFYVHQWRTSENVYQRDFIAFYTATRLPSSKLYDLEAQRQVQTSILGQPFPNEIGVLPFVNPPFVVPLLGLFCSDDYVTSYYRWRAFLLIVSLLNGALLVLILQKLGWCLMESFVASLTALMFPAIYSSIVKGQFSALIVCGALLCLLAVLSNYGKTSGFALGIALIKPHIALPVSASLLRSKPFSALSFMLVTVILLIVSSLMIGIAGVANLIHANSLVGNGLTAGQADMVNLLALMLKIGVPPHVARSMAWTVYIGALIFCLFWKRDALKAFGMATLCAVFFAPHVHFHDLYFLLPSMAIASNELRQRGNSLYILLFAPVAVLYLLVIPSLIFVLIALLIAVIIWPSTAPTSCLSQS